MRNKTLEYVVILEEGENSYGASVPDLPGCIAVGETLEEVRTLITEAIVFHIEGMRENGEVVPPSSPSSLVPLDIGMLATLIAVQV